MKIFKAYVAYIKDNPEGYWFKRKAYGWGWTPATREGWLVTITFILFVLLIGLRAEVTQLPQDLVLQEVLLPIGFAALLFLGVCYKTGEPPRWQWHLDRKYYQE
jgi:hypothetical protein